MRRGAVYIPMESYTHIYICVYTYIIYIRVSETMNMYTLIRGTNWIICKTRGLFLFCLSLLARNVAKLFAFLSSQPPFPVRSSTKLLATQIKREVEREREYRPMFWQNFLTFKIFNNYFCFTIINYSRSLLLYFFNIKYTHIHSYV